ncbi:hypothetical protein [Saccharopolyspora pogona]|uniref:hypothetical protein n=1 Tax=Saccharopolyspora pogona TaxID=333966 RepID=UPI0016828BA0|nr:hypothetical protein [Saccharopolyspora pogona]
MAVSQPDGGVRVDGSEVCCARPIGVPSEGVVLDCEGVQCAGEDLVGGAVVVALFSEFVDAGVQLCNFFVQLGFSVCHCFAGAAFVSIQGWF